MVPLAMFPLAGGALVDLDATVLIQLGIFLVVFLLLRSLLFKPVIGLIEERHAATVGAREDAERLSTEARELAEQVEERLGQARAEATTERERIIEEARRQERDLGVRAREDCQTLMDDTRAEAEKKATEARASLETEVPALAGLAAEKVLGRQLGKGRVTP